MASSVRYFSSNTLAFLHNRSRIFKLLRSPGIDSKEPIPPRNDNPIPTRLLASIDCSNIPAQINLIFLEARHVFFTRHEQKSHQKFLSRSVQSERNGPSGVWEFYKFSLSKKIERLIPVLRIWIRRFRMFFGLLDPDPLVRGTDPDPEPDLSISKQK